MSSERILVVEDDERLRRNIGKLLERLGYDVRAVPDVREAEAAIAEGALDAAVLDYQLTDGTALELLPVLIGARPRIPSVILTGHASIELAVKAIQSGADHFLTKPIEFPALGAMVVRLVELGRHERRNMAKASAGTARQVDPFLGRSLVMRELQAEARRVAAAETTVLIQGETGVGKGILARWLHDRGPRRDEPFVDLNCSVLTRELAESEMFGHRKGAFTGAVSDKVGLLEAAHHGTVFLDEIGDLEVPVQPKLLKALDEKRIRRVGDVNDRMVDVRLIAATHQDLAGAVDAGRFREDLYYRICAVPLTIPPLRDRREDIPALAQELLNGVAGEMGRLSVRLTDRCIDALSAYDWPGNARELRNVLERAVLLSDRGVLEPDDLRFQHAKGTGEGTPPSEDLSLEAMERRHIEHVLRMTRGNVTNAARRLEVPRSSLYEKIARHAIDVSEIRT